MKYIIALDFDQELPHYVCCKEDGSWNEVYSPKNATQFTTAKKATDWGKNNTTFGDYIVAVTYDSAVEKFDQWIADGMIRRSFPALDQKISRKYDPEKDDKYAVLDWRMKSHDNIRYEDYKTWPYLYSIFNHLWGVQTYMDSTMSFQIWVKKDSKFENFKEELDLILDKVTYREDNDIVLSIFDHFCGEGGNFAYLVKHDHDTWSVKTRYSFEVKKKTLEDCFDFMKRERYYE